MARRLFTASGYRFLGRRFRFRCDAFNFTGLGSWNMYCIRRRSSGTQRWQTVAYCRCAKLEATFDRTTHLMVCVQASRNPQPMSFGRCSRRRCAGPGWEPGWWTPVTIQKPTIGTSGVRSFIPAAIGRPSSKPHSGHYRRQMKRQLYKR